MSNDNELSFEELTGSTSVEEWTEATPDKELKSISEIAQEQIELQTAIVLKFQLIRFTKPIFQRRTRQMPFLGYRIMGMVV